MVLECVISICVGVFVAFFCFFFLDGGSLVEVCGGVCLARVMFRSSWRRVLEV